MSTDVHFPNVQSFFSHQAGQIALYLETERMINSIGPAEVEVKKTQISFGTNTKFAWIWLPEKRSKKRPKNSIILSFSVGRRIENEQIVEAVEPYPGRWLHHIIIQDESDLNKLVFTWLCEAYTFSLIRGRKVKPAEKEQHLIVLT
ncbi:DUF5655 domain-containing protein [Neobacillus sp. LXY-4]|uniref:DUF5655 domain-containing protein n=1 Tax=Neobacillus sp. LXY-4 TaxID=3379826 RepID=UPI003EE32273